jgi:hypothetical protein
MRRPKTSEGHTQAAIWLDVYSGQTGILPLDTKKATTLLEALKTLVTAFSAYGHTLRCFLFDNERVFQAMQNKIPGVLVRHTPTGLHNKRVERLICTMMEKVHAILAQQDYDLPDILEIELYEAALDTINCLPNSHRSGTFEV